jgi:hypothetical protein
MSIRKSYYGQVTSTSRPEWLFKELEEKIIKYKIVMLSRYHQLSSSIPFAEACVQASSQLRFQAIVWCFAEARFVNILSARWELGELLGGGPTLVAELDSLAMYILDEPSIGLHQKIRRLIKVLLSLRYKVTRNCRGT